MFTDDELAELALAADPDASLDAGALPLDQYLAEQDGTDGPLPSWYMPTPMARTRDHSRRRTAIIVAVIVAFLVIDGLGLCATYGPLVIA